MARTERFDELRSRRGIPQPPSPDEDPIGDMIRQQDFMRGYPVKPGYQERLGDPTKVITDVPPTLNAPMQREAGPYEDKEKRTPFVPSTVPGYPPGPVPLVPRQGPANPLPPGRPGERIGNTPPAMQTAQLQLPEGFELDTSGQKAPPEGRTADRPFSGIVGAGPFGERGMPQLPESRAQAAPTERPSLPPANVFDNMSYEQRLQLLQRLRGR